VVPALGWLAWDGKRWSRDGADDLVKIASTTPCGQFRRSREVREAASGGRDRRRDLCSRSSRNSRCSIPTKSRAGARLRSVNKLGALSKRGAPYLRSAWEKLDADKMKINVNTARWWLRAKAKARLHQL